MQLVDSHCHLDYEGLSRDLDAVVARARQAGVCRMVTISNERSAWPGVLRIAERYEDIWCTIGVHPHHAGKEGVIASDDLVEAARHPRVAGIGESGLDYHYENAPRDAQFESFAAHIDASRRTGLPLVVHSRDADRDMAQTLEDAWREGPFPGVMHCFTGGGELAERALAIGFYISLAGILTFRSADALRDVVRMVPMDRLLVETDAPFLAPVPNRGKRNEPAFVRHTLAALAGVKQVSEEHMAARTTANFHALFSRIPEPGSGATAA